LSDITVILLGAGSSSRFGLPIKKQWLWINEEPLWLHVAKRFEQYGPIIITASKDEAPFFQKYCNYQVVEGGATRQQSIQNALQFVTTPYVLISDIARACVSKELIDKVIANKELADCIAPAIKPPDTIVYRNETIDREEVLLVQTPQLSKTDLLAKAFGIGEFTDESSAMRALGGKVLYIEGERSAIKLTYKEDLKHLPCLKPPKKVQRVGYGHDVHAFSEDRKLYLCGVEIPHSKGLVGHSDADVAIHAIIDALLGAAGFGDIGELFPDSDPAFKGIDSKKLLARCIELLISCGFEIINIDLTILAQKPKLAPYKPLMQESIANILQIPKGSINIKATTTEGLGFVGKEEGIAASALTTITYRDWSQS